MFVKKFDEGDFLILLLYVDHILIVGRNPKKIGSLKKAESFAVKDMGPAKQILRMHIVRDRTKKLLWLSQEKYVTKVLQRSAWWMRNQSGRHCRPTASCPGSKARRRRWTRLR